MYFVSHLKINFDNLHHDIKRNGICNLRTLITSIVISNIYLYTYKKNKFITQFLV